MFSEPMRAVNDPIHGFCRDCLTRQSRPEAALHACGSPRVLRHPELYALTIAHIDCDAFYATVEKRDNPDIADKPVIIGGGKRGVVSAACYIARTFGVRSAMPMFKALAACPHAVVIRPDMAKYVRVGREVRHAMQALTPLVEPLSIDEAFLDLAGTQRVHGMIPAKVLARFAREVETRHRHHGVGRPVLQQVPRQDRLRPGQAARLCRDRPGRGREVPCRPAGDADLGRRKGVCGDAGARRDPHHRRLAGAERGDLMKRYGSTGDRLSHLSRGEDDRPVHPDHEPRASRRRRRSTRISPTWAISCPCCARCRKRCRPG